ncbi:MAG: Gfo/Idh/MocA family oxidoreductase [Chlorobi bacterium]|nr:Gfo/Idh/MocA family oxidoreductase [Chlorobiota bacterium]MCI0715201.1 Gfo/Idh/MocA family oxidoreductase [Chlorobiota bacterium]
MEKHNFALIGAAGFVAPRHLRAIKDNGQNLAAILDPNDSVGVVDSYFPEASFFTEFERFDRHVEKLRRKGEDSRIQYVSICSPNYLHDAHIRFALRADANAICEKPLVLNPWNADALKSLEKETGKRVFTILQLRLHPSIIALKKKFEGAKKNKKYDVVLTYITPRGKWYHYSWKGDLVKSGGIAMNIGIHFFDMLTWIFGKAKSNIVHHYKTDKAGGLLELENANVKWFLSIDKNDLQSGEKTYRSITINGEEIEFSEGFTDLHTISYKEILEGKGFSIDETKPSIEAVYEIRNSIPIGLKDDYHPFLKKLT